MSSIPNRVREVGPDGLAGRRRRLFAPLGAALLGLALLYLAGFSPADALHDGAHDARHSASFPCH